MKNLIIIFLLGLSIIQTEIILGTDECDDTNSPCEDTNASCNDGVGCECNSGYVLNTEKDACVAEGSPTPSEGGSTPSEGSGSGSKSGSGNTNTGNSGSDSNDSTSFLKYSLIAVLALLF